MSNGNGDADTEELIGQVVAGRYRVLELLGEGGMGAIFVAEHMALHKRVALKVVRAKHAGNEAAAARFAREAMVTATIEHPNVISAIDYGSLEDGGAFLAMQLVEGGTLTDLLAQEESLHWARAAHLGAQIADAVMAAGEHGIVHRDLKPDNILIQRNPDGTDLVKVLDFGIAKFSRDSLAPPSVREAQRVTKVGMVVGTPGYMAPEQALGEATDHRADLYALGVLLWECIVGRRLWHGRNVRAIVRRQLNNRAPRVRVVSGDFTIPESLDELVAMLTERDIENRPHDIQGVRDVLREVAKAGRNERELEGSVLVRLSERMHEIRMSQAPPADGPPKTPSGTSEMTPMTSLDSAVRPSTGIGRNYRVWAAVFGVSIALGVGVGALDRTPDIDPSAALLRASDQDSGSGQGTRGPQGGRRGTGLPSALDPHLEAIVRAETRTERVAAAETLLGHMPIGEVPKYARLVAHLQIAASCREKRDLVTTLATLGDPRALPALVMMSQRGKEGCGPKNRDCMACMRDELDETIQGLERNQPVAAP